MIKSLLKILLIISFGAIGCVSLNEYNYPEPYKKKSVEVVKEDPEKSWELFTEAVIWKESRGIEDAVGDNGKAIGVLQIHKIMVDDTNRILCLNGSNKRFTYNDRYDRDKSIAIFNIIQDHYNPGKDFKKAYEIWNSGHPDSYFEGIMKKYSELNMAS